MSSDNVRCSSHPLNGVFLGVSQAKSKKPRILDVFSLISIPSRGATCHFPRSSTYWIRICRYRELRGFSVIKKSARSHMRSSAGPAKRLARCRSTRLAEGKTITARPARPLADTTCTALPIATLCFYSPLASSGLADSRPSSARMRPIFFTCSALLAARSRPHNDLASASLDDKRFTHGADDQPRTYYICEHHLLKLIVMHLEGVPHCL